MAQAQMIDNTEDFYTETHTSNRLNLAQDKLARAFERLDAAVQRSMDMPRTSDAPPADDSAMRQQYLSLVEDYNSLLQHHEMLESRCSQAETALNESEQRYAHLKEINQTVSDRLDFSIAQIEELLQEE